MKKSARFHWNFIMIIQFYYTYTYICICIDTCIDMYAYIYLHIDMYIIHVFIHIFIYTYIYIYIHMYIYVNWVHCLESLLKSGRARNLPDKLQFWEIAQPALPETRHTCRYDHLYIYIYAYIYIYNIYIHIFILSAVRSGAETCDTPRRITLCFGSAST